MLFVGYLFQFPLSYEVIFASKSAITSCKNVWWNCVVQYLNQTLSQRSVLSLFACGYIIFCGQIHRKCIPVHTLDNKVTTREDEG